MSISITRPIIEAYDSSITDAAGGFALLAACNNNYPPALRRLAEDPTFVVESSNSGSEPLTIASSLCTLAALGVTFPANTLRSVLVKTYSRRAGATAAGYFERLHMFLGNAALGSVTTPADAAAIANDTNNGLFIPATGTFVAGATEDVVASHAQVDATAGPFIMAFNSTVAAFQTPTATVHRVRCEIFVFPLVIFPTF